MDFRIKVIVGLSIFFSSALHPAQAGSVRCEDIFKSSSKPSQSSYSMYSITERELIAQVASRVDRVLEFRYIRELSQTMGLRVWLLGGSASSLLHYIKWDLEAEKGIRKAPRDHFTYDIAKIFSDSQDFDIVVDADPQVAMKLRDMIEKKFPLSWGSQSRWEVRSLHHPIGHAGEAGFKEALLDEDFLNQNADSHSDGMLELSTSEEPRIRGLRAWNKSESVFLQDALHGRLTFWRSNKHLTTSRAKAGEIPEVLSALRALVKAAQFDLSLAPESLKEIKSIAAAFSPTSVTNAAARRRIEQAARKLVLNAMNVERAYDLLDEVELRQKLISMGAKEQERSTAWLLNREPLRGKPVGEGRGKTARELSIDIVTHITDFAAYRSITRSFSGFPNALKSRENTHGERAKHGDGFYVMKGETSYSLGKTMMARYKVEPNAREGSDFTVHGSTLVFLNKYALTFIPETVDCNLDEYLKLADPIHAKELNDMEEAQLQQRKLLMNSAKISNEIDRLLYSGSEKDLNRLDFILNSFHQTAIDRLIERSAIEAVAHSLYQRISSLADAPSSRMLYMKVVGAISPHLASTEEFKQDEFMYFLSVVMRDPEASFTVRKQALFQLLMASNDPKLDVSLHQTFAPNEISSLASEIARWHQSKNPRKQRFAITLNRKVSETIAKGDLNQLISLIDSGLIEVNFSNLSDVSILQLAAYHRREEFIEWLLANPRFDFNRKNHLGWTEVEQLRLSGYTDIADHIQKHRPEVTAKMFRLTERNPNRSPIVDFIRIESGWFMMGNDIARGLTRITKPFEILSIPTTHEIFVSVAKLLRTHLRGQFLRDYAEMENSPQRFKGPSQPIEQTYGNIDLWISGLNELSTNSDARIQLAIASVLPGHKQGAKYRLPTDAEWERVARLGGVAEGEYSHRDSSNRLDEYVNFDATAVNGRHASIPVLPVGSKKPVFYNGKPIYDLHGNVAQLVLDWHSWSPFAPGGIDPRHESGLSSRSPHRITRGGSSEKPADQVRTEVRQSLGPLKDAGFRIVRMVNLD